MSAPKSHELGYMDPAALFVVNLKENTVRYQNCAEQLQRLIKGKGGSKWPVARRVLGVLGKQIRGSRYESLVEPSVLDEAAQGSRREHAAHNLGSLGCYLSHSKAWYLFARALTEPATTAGVSTPGGDDYCLVFEDDFQVPSDFPQQLRKVLVNAPENWEVLVLGPYGLHMGTRGTVDVKGTQWIRPIYWTCLNAYVIRRSFCRFLLENCYPPRVQVDWFMGKFSEQHGLYILQTPITSLSQHYKASDIQHTPVYWPFGHQSLLAKQVTDAERDAVYRTARLGAGTAVSDSNTLGLILLSNEDGVPEDKLWLSEDAAKWRPLTIAANQLPFRMTNRGLSTDGGKVGDVSSSDPPGDLSDGGALIAVWVVAGVLLVLFLMGLGIYFQDRFKNTFLAREQEGEFT